MPDLSCAAIVVVALMIIFAICAWIEKRAYRSEALVQGIVVNVLTDYADAGEAIDAMRELDLRMLRILAHLRRKYMIGAADEELAGRREALSGPGAEDKRRIVENVVRRFNYEELYENRPPPDGIDTAYSLMKGAKIKVCLRDRDRQRQFIDPNLIVFVMIHELAHIGAYDVWGHPPRFWRIFKFLLREAVESGAYKPVDFGRHGPANYCGLTLASNPLFDPLIENI